jgi:hypothetical protein
VASQSWVLLDSTADPTGAANTAGIAALWASVGAGEYVIVWGSDSTTLYPMRAVGDYTIRVPTGKGLLGAVVGDTFAKPHLDLMSWDGLGTQNGLIGIGTANTIKDCIVDNFVLHGGRGLARFALAGTTACANISATGHLDWVAGTPHNLIIRNIINYEPRGQAISLNSVNGATITNVTNVRPTSAAEYTCHHFDIDSVAFDKPTQDVSMDNVDLDSYGNECMKLENARRVTVTNFIFRSFVSLNQDNVEQYSELGPVTLTDGRIDAPLYLRNIKRRRADGVTTAHEAQATGRNLTLSGTGTVGNTITATRAGSAFTGADVGKSIGPTYTAGYGFGIIESEAAGTVTIRVHDVFNKTTYAPGSGENWSLSYGDNSGSGALTIRRVKFGRHGFIWPQQNNVNDYGTQTIEDCEFHPLGNSYAYPVGFTVTTNNKVSLNVQSRKVRWVRHPGNTTFSGVVSVPAEFTANSCMWRESAVAIIDNGAGAIFYSSDADIVYIQNGVYSYNTNTGNRFVSGLRGKNILVAAETDYGVVMDGVNNAQTGSAFGSDVAGATVRGIVMTRWKPAGSGAAWVVTGGTIRLLKTRAYDCSCGNQGAGYRIASAASNCVVEDYEADTCAGGASSAGGVYNQSTTSIFRRGLVRNCTATTNVAGVRNDCAGGTFDGLVCHDNSGAPTGGFLQSAGSGGVLRGYVAYNNTGTLAHDFNVNNTLSLTGHSWICMSDNGSAIKAVNVTGATGALTLDKATIYGGSGNVTGTGTKNLTNITSSTDATAIFEDVAGRNFQLKSTATGQVGTGTLIVYTASPLSDIPWDRFEEPALTANQGAYS